MDDHVGLWICPVRLVGACSCCHRLQLQAQRLLAQGGYTKALKWLDRAGKLNPSLDQLPSYHIERGQAWYFLYPEQPIADSQVYLAAFYRQRNDLLASYQQLLAARQHAPAARWVLDEFAVTLERFSLRRHTH